MIQEERVKTLNCEPIRNGDFVLYWMQASQRTEYNHALEYAVSKANELNRPVVTYFGITDTYPEANERHYYFMLEGLKDVQASLEERGIRLVVWHKSPELGAVELSRNACLVVTDRGYLEIQKRWRSYAAEHAPCPFIQVESDVVIPVEEASPKEEYSAATFRPKIKGKLDRFLVPMKGHTPEVDSLDLDLSSFAIKDIEKAISRLNIDRSVKRVKDFHGGPAEAKRHLESFLKHRLERYQEFRNDPTQECLSNMSPYLHFGHISPLYVALKVLETESSGRDAYLEELIVRRELSVNFVFYNEKYDSFDGLPEWARKTLMEHKRDEREYVYTLRELENGETHDPYWNAAQNEMKITGKMHGYTRMYWGKKILEWSREPEDAFKIALHLNNKYELDGRDPNGFTGVAWCFGKHDRPWKERGIFGKVRYMSAQGLERKFDVDRYVKKIKSMN
ncbi:MAG: deoxyribodipyrimidine photo-lyase [Candidatus Bathyarchaeia archaeon]